MKSLPKTVFFLTVSILLAGCGQASGQAPTPDIKVIRTNVMGTIEAQMTEAAPTSTITPHATITLSPTITPTPFETVFPTIDPTKLPGLLESSLVIETRSSFKGHLLQRITGWSNGFNGFSWWGANHMLLYPIIGREWQEMRGRVFLSRATVMNLSSGKILLNGLGNWSEQLNAMVRLDGLYSADGDLIKAYHYEGNLLGISPSGTKMLVETADANATWIDLINEKKVLFTWHRSLMMGGPVWSSDEMQVYGFNKIYGNAKTGESFAMVGTIMDGKNLDFLYEHYHAMWVLNGKYILPVGWSSPFDGTPGFIGILDPTAKTYYNLSALAGVPYEFNMLPQVHSCNNSVSTVTDGRYIWVNCTDGGRLIDLETRKSYRYPNYPEVYPDWSADGSFAWIWRHGDKGQKILSGKSKEIKPMPVDIHCPTWHPTKNVFVYTPNNRKTLVIFDPDSMSIQKKIDLPVAFDCFSWNTTADKMMMVADDNSIWQIDYPSLDHLEQLTPSIDDLGWPTWSPDGAHLAFSAGKDIYIVDTTSTK